MLYLTRRPGEAVIINNAIEVRVVELKGKSVKLGFTFPANATVLREEVFLQIKAENEAAVAASADVLRPRTAETAAAESVATGPEPRAEAQTDDSAGEQPERRRGDRRGLLERLTATATGGDRRRPDDG